MSGGKAGSVTEHDAITERAGIIHAAHEHRLRELLAAAAMEARATSSGAERSQDLDIEEAAALWHAVLSGRWSLLAQVDDGGHRCFLARQNDPAVPTGAPLSERERRIASYASLGHSNKLIAFELGMCSSSVATQLTSATRKLGLASRETLLHAFAVLDRGTKRASSLPASAPRPDERDPAVRVIRLLSDGHAYAVIRIAIAPNLPPSLTAAEREVATLVVSGLSNAAIAARRKTSVRTVANQLRSIFAKLGVGSRRQLCSRYTVQ